MADDVWAAITPMRLMTGGDMILISTPKAKSGYFYESYIGDGVKTFHVNSVEVVNNRPMSDSWNKVNKEFALERLSREKKRMTKNQFKQEYLGKFIDDINQFFSDEIIKKCMTEKKGQELPKNGEFYLGVDVARMGGDESVFEVLIKQENGNLRQVMHQTMTKA